VSSKISTVPFSFNLLLIQARENIILAHISFFAENARPLGNFRNTNIGNGHSGIVQDLFQAPFSS
jgi:hypothetical protein